MSRKKIILIVILVIVVLALAYGFVHSAGSKPQPGPAGSKDKGPVPVTVVPVQEKAVPTYLFAHGTVHARKTVNVQPRIGGLMDTVNFQEGTRVEKGQVLARIDPRTYQAQYEKALALEKQDKARLATARSNLKRSRKLVKSSYISQQDLTELQNTLSQYQAAVAADKASVRDAKLQLDYTKIRAPITGLAGLRRIDPGNMVAKGDSLVVITQVRPTNVLFSLPAENLAQVRSAQSRGDLSVAALASADNHILADNGKVIAIGNRIDSASATFQVKAQFPNKDDALWPGQFVNVRLRVGTVENGLVVPTTAVQRGPNGEYVYLVKDDDTVTMQSVQTAGEASVSHTLIGSGLQAGDQVVTEGAFRIKQGSKVTPLAPGEVAPPASASAPAAPASVAPPSTTAPSSAATAPMPAAAASTSSATAAPAASPASAAATQPSNDTENDA